MFTGGTSGERWQHCDSKVPVEKLPLLFADVPCKLLDRALTLTPTLFTMFSLASNTQRMAKCTIQPTFCRSYNNEPFKHTTSAFIYPSHSPIYLTVNNRVRLSNDSVYLPKTRRQYKIPLTPKSF